MYSVYCSGSIAKGPTDEKKLCWSDKERHDLADGLGGTVVFLNPDDPITDPANTLGQFGRDMFQVLTASAVVVDARERRGLGIGVEMAAAAALKTPVISVAPLNTKYRVEKLSYRGVTVHDYVHPHVATLSSVVVEDFFQAGIALRSLPSSKTPPEGIPHWLEEAINEYEHNVLSGDEPMRKALSELQHM